jgi:hypothetical protein
MIRSHALGSSSRNLPKAAIPALLIKMSIVLNLSKASTYAVSTESISETSAVSVNDFTPKLFTCVATSSKSDCVRDTKITFTPSFANAIDLHQFLFRHL